MVRKTKRQAQAALGTDEQLLAYRGRESTRSNKEKGREASNGKGTSNTSWSSLYKASNKEEHAKHRSRHSSYFRIYLLISGLPVYATCLHSNRNLIGQ